MNTEFFEKANDLTKDFKWRDIFSEALQPHTKEERRECLSRGISNQKETLGERIRHWRKPWLFVPAAVIALAIALLSVLCILSFPGSILVLPFAFTISAFVTPVAVLIFYWEMNIPGDISLMEAFILILLGGILSIVITFFVMTVDDNWPDAAFISGPFPEELGKFIAVCILMSFGRYRYGLHGILVGGAVGVGFAAIESAGYAMVFYEKGGQGSMVQTLVLRGLLAAGGHSVWAALYGGAVGLVKNGGKKLSLKRLADPLVVMAFSAAFLLHTLWNLGAADLVNVLPYAFAKLWLRMELLNVKYLILIVLVWSFLLFLMRKCIRQILFLNGSSEEKKVMEQPLPVNPVPAVSEVLLTVTALGGVNDGKVYELRSGERLVFGRDKSKARVLFPADTKGVSSVHCEIREKGGFPVLIDCGSTYGTFFSDKSRLEPHVAYKIKGSVRFYLAAESNSFRIQLKNQL